MEPDVSSDAAPEYTSAAPRRRSSMEEDRLYRDLMTAKAKVQDERTSAEAVRVVDADIQKADDEQEDVLPPYSCDIHVETVFQRKMEIEGTTKRADDRSWAGVYIVLHGTALNIYRCKSGWSLNRSRTGPDISQDKPPWMKAGTLEKSYSLAYADVGIAADYVKRKHVIRIRAEQDQFLISCVELETFVTWLDALFAAISVAAPIDDRDFPRDQSIPRIQRVRLLRGQTTTVQVDGTQYGVRISTQPDGQQSSSTAAAPAAETTANAAAERSQPSANGRGLAASMAINFSAELREEQSSRARAAHFAVSGTSRPRTSGATTSRRGAAAAATPDTKDGEDGEATGKWRPKHKWTATHDMVYAKLCYANLLFKSPRKSNYIVIEGRQWFVDWASGKMIRVHPPRYGEVELFGPWQVVSVENRRL